jgi:tetraacyldisaccharide 4'-kinase
METYIRQVMSGQARGATAGLARTCLAVCEPFYATALHFRNYLFDAGIRKTTRLPRPVISVGNITTGGTGKTPMVRWIAQQLQTRQLRPAVLMRGYKSTHGHGDEQLMLQSMLPGVPIEADSNRAAAAKRAINETTVDCFILDDGFQHRQVARDFDLVLINAMQPFGWNHVLPRGMLREKLIGTKRADAFVITRADQVNKESVDKIEHELRQWNTSAPIYRAMHSLTTLRDADGNQTSIDDLTRKPFAAFAGIGSPEALDNQLRAMGAAYLGGEWLPDHAAYDEQLLQNLLNSAESRGARAIVTTEKDWVKIAPLPAARSGLPILRVDVGIRFFHDDADRLMQQIGSVLHQ